jgi:acyl-[acyl carrier protein]--UDP-N-acetylglucosamine O-acyltransferase
MQRRGFERKDIHDLRNAYKLLIKSQEGTFEERLGNIKTLYQGSPAVKELLDFIEENPKRHLCLPSEDWEFSAPSDMEPSPRVACA